jgi:hypothetical protein
VIVVPRARTIRSILGSTCVVSLDHESCEELGERVEVVQREHVRDVLVRSDNDDAALLAINAAHLEDVDPAFRSGQNICS